MRGKFVLFIFNPVYTILTALNLHRILEAVNGEIILSNLYFMDEEVKANRS